MLAPKVSFEVGVAERDSNKLSPQLPISVNASWPRLNLGGANEYLFFFFAGTAGDIDNEDMLSSSGGSEVGSSSSSPASSSPILGLLTSEASCCTDSWVTVDVEITEALSFSSSCSCRVEGILRSRGCGVDCWFCLGCEVGIGDFSITLIGGGLSR